MALPKRPLLPDLMDKEAQRTLEAGNKEGHRLHDIYVLGAIERLWWTIYELEKEVVRLQNASGRN